MSARLIRSAKNAARIEAVPGGTVHDLNGSPEKKTPARKPGPQVQGGNAEWGIPQTTTDASTADESKNIRTVADADRRR
jgi:hypothetical protein